MTHRLMRVGRSDGGPGQGGRTGATNHNCMCGLLSLVGNLILRVIVFCGLLSLDVART